MRTLLLAYRPGTPPINMLRNLAASQRDRVTPTTRFLALQIRRDKTLQEVEIAFRQSNVEDVANGVLWVSGWVPTTLAQQLPQNHYLFDEQTWYDRDLVVHPLPATAGEQLVAELLGDAVLGGPPAAVHPDDAAHAQTQHNQAVTNLALELASHPPKPQPQPDPHQLKLKIRAARRLYDYAMAASQARYRDTTCQLDTVLLNFPPLAAFVRATSRLLTGARHATRERAEVTRYRLDDFRGTISNAIAALENYEAHQATHEPPTWRNIWAALTALEGRYDEIQWVADDKSGRKCLIVETEEITLDDRGDYETELGSFNICLRWENLYVSPNGTIDCGEPFRAWATEPNKTSDGYEHPHVSQGKVCMGDHHTAMFQALRRGDIDEAVYLVDGVLKNYNAGSPYEKLSRWHQDDSCTCEGCGAELDEDDAYHTDGGTTLCDDCCCRVGDSYYPSEDCTHVERTGEYALNDDVSNCYDCGNADLDEEMATLVTADGSTAQVCPRCRDRHYTRCPHCEDYTHDDNIKTLDSAPDDDDRTYCPRCWNEHTADCAECGERCAKDDLNPEGICGNCDDLLREQEDAAQPQQPPTPLPTTPAQTDPGIERTVLTPTTANQQEAA